MVGRVGVTAVEVTVTKFGLAVLLTGTNVACLVTVVAVVDVEGALTSRT